MSKSNKIEVKDNYERNLIDNLIEATALSRRAADNLAAYLQGRDDSKNAQRLITSTKINIFHTHPLYEAQQEYRRKVKGGLV